MYYLYFNILKYIIEKRRLVCHLSKTREHQNLSQENQSDSYEGEEGPEKFSEWVATTVFPRK